jgi:hypothetical protein
MAQLMTFRLRHIGSQQGAGQQGAQQTEGGTSHIVGTHGIQTHDVDQSSFELLKHYL